MRELYKWSISYFLSLCLVTLILVYILNLPGFITQSAVLVKEYYYEHALSSFVLDVFLIAAYISISMYAGKAMKINPTDNAQQLIVLFLTILVISGSFMLYFSLGYNPSTFFARWFKRVGYKAIIYDVIFVCSVYIIMMVLYNNFF